MMAWSVTRDGAQGRTISKSETKVCPLCGTLNYCQNRECLACKWRGAFESDGAAIDYHWQGLLDRHEEVRLEHVTPGAARALGDFGKPRKVSPWQRLSFVLADRWNALVAGRKSRRASGATVSRPESALPPFELGLGEAQPLHE